MRHISILIIAVLAMAACRSTEYVAVPESHTVNVERAVYVHDSIESRDSIIIRSERDTVFVEKWKTRTRILYVHDTLSVEHRDSIRVPYPVEKKLSKWQQLKIDWFGELCAVLIALLSAIIIYIVWRTRQKIL